VQTDTLSTGRLKSLLRASLSPITVSTEDVWRSMRASHTVLIEKQREKRCGGLYNDCKQQQKDTQEVH